MIYFNKEVTCAFPIYPIHATCQSIIALDLNTLKEYIYETPHYVTSS
jgi:hypothetical protein